MKRVLSRLASAAPLAAAVAVVASSQPCPPAPDVMGRGEGSFNTDCFYTHRLSDDPIVFPRGAGQSHSHDFLGATTTDADSTPESILAGGTNCDRYGSANRDSDRSAYWVPTLYDDGKPVPPGQTGVYYQTGYRDPRAIRPFPADLKIIAGDSKGVAPADNNGQRTYAWACSDTPLDPGSRTVAPTCTDTLVLTLTFPDCWDGVHADSTDHKSHMAYSDTLPDHGQQRFCPLTAPVLVPQLRLTIPYATTGGPAVRLASGGIETAHGDFMNGWDPAELERLVSVCLNVDEYCGGTDSPVPNHD